MSQVSDPQHNSAQRVASESNAPGRFDTDDDDLDGLAVPALAATLDALIVIDTDGHIRFWNASAEEMFGYEFAEVRRRKFVDLIVPPEYRAVYTRGMQRCFDSGQPRILAQPFEAVAVRRSGERFPAMITVTRLPGIGPPMILGTVRDISRQRAAALERGEIERRFRTLVEQLPVVVFTDATDAHYTPLYVSQQIETLLGYTVEEWLSDPESWQKNIHPDDKRWVLKSAANTSYDEVFEIEYRMVHKDGHTVWIREKSATVFGDDGAPMYSQGIFVDISDQKRTEAHIRETEARYRSLVEQTPAITIRSDGADMVGISYVSPQIRKILGYEPAAWVANPNLFVDCVHPEDRTTVIEAYRASIETGKPFNLEFRQRAADGRDVWMNANLELVRAESDEPLFWQGILTDVTERRAMENEFEALRSRYQHFAAHSTDAIIVNDRNGRFLFANGAFVKMVGYSEEELQHIPVMDLIAPPDVERVRAIGLRMLHGGPPPSGPAPIRYVTRSGDIVTTEASFGLVYEQAEPIGFQVIIRDITDRVQMEEALAYQAFHDGLTGLANRARLVDELALRLAGPGADRDFALVFLDLDNFKVLNDSLGHDIGDLALIEVGRRIQACLEAEDFVSRFGGDEFVILVDSSDQQRSVIDVVQRLVDAFDTPIQISERNVRITTSIGVAECTADVKRTAELLRRADLAMYESKARGRNQFTFHNPGMDQRALDRLELEADLRRALKDDDLAVVYQPIVDLTTQQIVGVEALVRWNHPQRGVLAPADFISIAEASGLIIQVDRWVLREALREVHRWSALTAIRPFQLNVNMSARQLDQPDFVECINAMLAQYAPADMVQLGLELTESAMLNNADQAKQKLKEVNARGVRIVLDDFGMGYSSLAQVRNIPLSSIKIDRQFTSELGESNDALIIVSGMIELSHALGLSVVAEGIETEPQARLLSYLDCDYAQGHYFGKPLSSGDFVALLQAGNDPATTTRPVSYTEAVPEPTPAYDLDG